MSDPYAEMKKAADLIAEERDNWLRAVGAIAAHGGIQVVPMKNSLGGTQAKAIICLPERQYDRLHELMSENQEN